MRSDLFWTSFDDLFNGFDTIKTNNDWSIMKVTYSKLEGGELLAKFYVPGFGKEDVKVKAKENTLIIEVKETRKEYAVAAAYDLTKLKAKISNGILEVTIPVKKDESELVVEIE